MTPQITELTRLISSFPGIGYKSANRIVFFLLKQKKEYISNLVETIKYLQDNISYCTFCGIPVEINIECQFCSTDRDHSAMCVIEQPTDALSIENSGDFHGLYHVLMGSLSPLDGIGPEDIRLKELYERTLKNSELKEIIIATNPSIEGNATAHYIADHLHKFSQIKITRIASGLAMGSQIEYADSRIIAQSLRSRTLL